MAGSGAAFTRASGALAKVQSLSTSLASRTTGSDGASRIASGDTAGGALWTTMAGFVTALLGGQVTHSLPTRAQMVANPVPSAITTIATSGFASSGDGGGATYVRATGPFSDGASFQSHDGAWWQLASTAINPAMFGAVGYVGQGTTGPDDTAALQAAITYAVANGCALHFFARSYRHTRSLNWGKTSPFDGKNLKVHGTALGYSRLVSDMSETYPAHDFTNQIGGSVEKMFFATSTTSQHNTQVLLAETTGTGINGFAFRDCVIQDQGPSSRYAVFGFTADQINFDNTQVFSLTNGALAGAFFSINNPAGIASKFYSIVPSNADVTVFQASMSAFACQTGPGLWTQAYSNVTLISCYSGVLGTGGHNKGAYRFGGSLVGGAGRITSIYMAGCRSEANQQASATALWQGTASIVPYTDNMTSVMTVTATASGALQVGMVLAGSGVAGATSVLAQLTSTTWQVGQFQTVASTTISSHVIDGPAIYNEDYIFNSNIQGTFGTQGCGVLGGPGIHYNTTAAIGLGNGCFELAGALIGGSFSFWGGTNYGGAIDFVNSRQYKLAGRIGNDPANLAAYGPTAAVISDLGLGNPYAYQDRLSTSTRVMFGDGTTNTAVNFRLKPSGESGTTNTTAYTGGSGLQPVIGPLSFNPSYLYYTAASAGDLSFPQADIDILGVFASTWAASGQLQFVANQIVAGAAKTATLVTMTGIPAYAAGSGFRCKIKMVGGSGGGWIAVTTLEIMGAAPMSMVTSNNLHSIGFSANAGTNFTVTGNILNGGTNPLVPGVTYTVG